MIWKHLAAYANKNIATTGKEHVKELSWECIVAVSTVRRKTT